MGISAIIKLADRSARRNHLYLFAWLCAIVVPVGLQLISGTMDELRDYLAYYFGAISLYMFFAMTFGFGTVFVSYYVVGGMRKAGTLDLLRVAGGKPWEVSLGVFLTLQKILVPPILVFAAGFVAYMLLFVKESFLLGQPWWQLLGMGAVILFNEMILALIPCLALFRREALLSLLAAILVLPLNALPVIMFMGMRVPFWAYLLVQTGFVALLMAWSMFAVGRLWPAQKLPHD